MRLIYTILAFLFFAINTLAQSSSLDKVVKKISSHYNVRFVYNGSLKLKVNYDIKTIGKAGLNSDLLRLFENTDISWEIDGDYVLLKKVNTHTISGVILNSSNSKPLDGAAITNSITQQIIYTNKDGSFTLNLREGNNKLSISHIGFMLQKAEFKLSNDSVININLQPNIIEVDEVKIEGNENSLHNKLNAEIDVLFTNIKRTPKFLGENDILNSIEYIPGVNSSSDGKSNLIVRGGGAEQNLILLDGVPIYNPNHMYGFLSIFNTDIIDNVTLYKSAFPARYGERLSSVIDIETNDKIYDEFGGSASMGVLAAKVYVETPVFKEESSLTVSSRRSYVDLFIDRLQDQNDIVNFYFYDINIKYNHKISNKTKLLFTIYNGQDKLKNNYTGVSEDVRNFTKTNTSQNWDWGNTIIAAQLNHLLSSNFILKSSLSFNSYAYNAIMDENTTIKLSESNSPDAIINKSFKKIDYQSQINDYSLKLDADFNPNSNHYFRFGASATMPSFNPEIIYLSSTNAPNIDDSHNNYINGLLATLYAEDDWTISNRIKTNLGLRFSAYSVNNKTYSSLEPRLSFSYHPTNNFTLQAAYADMQQYINMLSSNSIVFQADLWMPITENLSPMTSKQYSLGAYYNLNKNLFLSTEVYYKNMKNVIEYKHGTSFIGAKIGWQNNIVSGIGRAYGVEFLLEKRNGKTTGNISYSLSKSERKFNEINNNIWFRSRHDKPHNFGINISHRFNKRWDCSVSWNYSSGNLLSIPTEYIKIAEIPDFDNSTLPPIIEQVDYINNYQLKDYHRLDIGVSYTGKTNNYNQYGVWNFSIFNVYNRMNAQMAYVNEDTEGTLPNVIQLTIMPIIPSISYTFNF